MKKRALLRLCLSFVAALVWSLAAVSSPIASTQEAPVAFRPFQADRAPAYADCPEAKQTPLSDVAAEPYLDELGPAFHVGGKPIYGASLSGQGDVSVAFNGEVHMFVWIDGRTGNNTILGARMTAEGALLDTLSIEISGSAGHVTQPEISSDGSDFLVVWTDSRDMNESWTDIYGARISPSGAVLDPRGIPICTAAGYQRHPSVAFNGTHYLVAWIDGRFGPHKDIYVARLDGLGTVIDPDGKVISNTDESKISLDVASDGEQCLVVWHRYMNGESDIIGRRVGQSGEPLDPAGIELSATEHSEYAPRVTSNGTDYFVVWYDSHNGQSAVRAARVSGSGSVLDAAGVTVSQNGREHYPSVGSDGGDYLVFWEDNRDWRRDFYCARVTSSAEVQDPGGVLVSTGESVSGSGRLDGPDVAFGKAEWMTAWAGAPGGYEDCVCGARVSRTGSVLDDEAIIVSLGTDVQRHPAASFDGASYVLAWLGYHDSYSDIYASRVDPWGTVLNERPIPISMSGSTGPPTVASGAENTIIVWPDGREGRMNLYFARMSRTGEVLDPAGRPICDSAETQRLPAVAFDGTNFTVVWTEAGTESGGVFAARISQNGDVLDPAGVRVSAGTEVFRPAIEFGKTDYLVTWQEYPEGNTTEGIQVRGTRLSPYCEVLDPEGITVSSMPGHLDGATPSFDGENFLVVWSGKDFDDHSDGLYCARVDQSGRVLDPEAMVISDFPGSKYSPDVTFDGSYHMVVWGDGRCCRSDLYGCRVTPSGAVLDDDGFPVAAEDIYHGTPCVALGEGGQMLIAYTADTPYSPYYTDRTWAKLWNPVAYDPAVLLELSRNPSRGEVGISYTLPGDSRVRLAVFDVRGRLVRTLRTGYRGPGRYLESWNGKDRYWRDVPTGIYFIRIQCSHGRAAAKCLMVR
jgi:hypothetical protein